MSSSSELGVSKARVRYAQKLLNLQAPFNAQCENQLYFCKCKMCLLGGVRDLGADNANKLAMNYKFCFVKPPAPGAAGGTVVNGTVASVYDHLEGCGMNNLPMQVLIRKTAVFAVLKG